MFELGLNIEEFDKLLFICAGTGILQLVPADLDDVFFYLEEVKKRKNSSGGSKVLWDNIKNCTGEFRMDNYAKIDVQFPYFLEPNLKAILVRAKQESKDRKDAMII